MPAGALVQDLMEAIRELLGWPEDHPVRLTMRLFGPFKGRNAEEFGAFGAAEGLSGHGGAVGQQERALGGAADGREKGSGAPGGGWRLCRQRELCGERLRLRASGAFVGRWATEKLHRGGHGAPRGAAPEALAARLRQRAAVRLRAVPGGPLARGDARCLAAAGGGKAPGAAGLRGPKAGGGGGAEAPAAGEARGGGLPAAQRPGAGQVGAGAAGGGQRDGAGGGGGGLRGAAAGEAAGGGGGAEGLAAVLVAGLEV